MTFPAAQPLDDEEPDSAQESPGERSSLLARLLLKKRTLFIARPIDRRLTERVGSLLFLLESEDPEADINVFVNSPGGDADCGFAIYDLLRFVRPRVRTFCTGLAASAAVPIFLGGDKGQRFSLPHSRFLLHQPSMQMSGQASDLEITAAQINRIRETYNRLVADEIGRPFEKVAADSDRDFWLSAPEAIDYGLVDRLIQTRADLD